MSTLLTNKLHRRIVSPMSMNPEDEMHKKPAGRPRGSKNSRPRRSSAIEVKLTGEVAAWVKAEAKKNFRTPEGQVAYCVAQVMESAHG